MSDSKLKTVGKDGKEYFSTYELEKQYDQINDIYKICFKTLLEGIDKKKWFDFKVAPVGENYLKVTDMFDYQNIYKGKGLPEALILEAQKQYPINKSYPVLTGKRFSKMNGDLTPGLLYGKDWKEGVWQNIQRKKICLY